MRKIHAVVAGAVASVALTVATVTYSQPFAGMGQGFGPGFGHGMGAGMGPGHGMGAGMGPGYGPMAGVDRSSIVESRLGEMKAQLNITPAQETAWQAFAGAAKQQADSMQALHARMQEGPATAPDQMSQHAELMQQRGAAMATMANAFNALYAALTPDQKAIADQRFARKGHHGMPFARGAG